MQIVNKRTGFWNPGLALEKKSLWEGKKKREVESATKSVSVLST